MLQLSDFEFVAPNGLLTEGVVANVPHEVARLTIPKGKIFQFSADPFTMWLTKIHSETTAGGGGSTDTTIPPTTDPIGQSPDLTAVQSIDAWNDTDNADWAVASWVFATGVVTHTGALITKVVYDAYLAGGHRDLIQIFGLSPDRAKKILLFQADPDQVTMQNQFLSSSSNKLMPIALPEDFHFAIYYAAGGAERITWGMGAAASAAHPLDNYVRKFTFPYEPTQMPKDPNTALKLKKDVLASWR